jgi:signal transduction histidine kinase
MTSITLAQWLFLLEPLVRAGDVTPVDRVVYLAYPAMDLLLFAALARLFVTEARRTPAYVLLATSILLLVVADEIYGGSSSSYVSGSWLDGLWLLSYVAWGAAALHPSVRHIAQARDDARPTLSAPRFIALGAALLAVPAMLLVDSVTGRDVDGVALAVGGSLLGALVLGRLVLLVRDIERLTGSERVARAEAEAAQRLLAEQNDRLRELDRLKDQFVASVSHDLRTPLTSIAGYVELLSEEADSLDEEQQSFLRVVSRNADRLMTLVDDLLFVARLRAGGVELSSCDHVDLARIAEECVESALPRADGEGIELGLEAETRPVVRGDRRRLAQVVDNLVTNAIKFTTDGGRVQLRVGDENGRATIKVADSGIGIPAEEIARLFDPFYRASTAVDRQIPGTGLGLHIVEAIVEAHGGRITVNSAEGVGTTFRVELPALAADKRSPLSGLAA